MIEAQILFHRNFLKLTIKKGVRFKRLHNNFIEPVQRNGAYDITHDIFDENDDVLENKLKIKNKNILSLFKK